MEERSESAMKPQADDRATIRRRAPQQWAGWDVRVSDSSVEHTERADFPAPRCWGSRERLGGGFRMVCSTVVQFSRSASERRQPWGRVRPWRSRVGRSSFRRASKPRVAPVDLTLWGSAVPQLFVGNGRTVPAVGCTHSRCPPSGGATGAMARNTWSVASYPLTLRSMKVRPAARTRSPPRLVASVSSSPLRYLVFQLEQVQRNSRGVESVGERLRETVVVFQIVMSQEQLNGA